MRRSWVLILVLLLAGCAPTSYLLPSGPPHAGQRNPASVGSPVPAVVLFLEPRPGDQFELISAEAIGTGTGATVRFFLSRAVIQADGSRLIGELREELAGARIGTAADASPGPANAVGIIAEVTLSQAGRYELSSVRLRYRLNGGAEQVGEGIDVVFTVCAAVPAPTTCEE